MVKRGRSPQVVPSRLVSFPEATNRDTWVGKLQATKFAVPELGPGGTCHGSRWYLPWFPSTSTTGLHILAYLPPASCHGPPASWPPARMYKVLRYQYCVIVLLSGPHRMMPMSIVL